MENKLREKISGSWRVAVLNVRIAQNASRRLLNLEANQISEGSNQACTHAADFETELKHSSWHLIS